ncbi:MAG: Pr6Pr family membrane protein [Eubacterium sp.]|nr:Pr6Pr family membrane protein [Eubacterium sp.]
MEEKKINPLYTKKWFGIVLLILGVFSVMVILHRLAYYVYEFDPKYSPIDYGRFNILSYFTVQSNIFVCFYLLVSAFAVFGNKKAQKIAFDPMLGAMVTTYIIVTGVVYCCGIPLGFTPPFKWDNPTHAMSSFIQVYHHMIIPPIMLALWFFPAINKKVSYKKAWLFGIYPLAYSIFSMVRGAISNPTFYPYPFYEPSFFANMLFADKGLNLFQSYLLMLPVLVVGIGIFIALGAIIILINNRLIKEINE